MKILTKDKIPPRRQQILYNQIIDEVQPGTILRDFECFLSFVQKNAPLTVTSTNSLLPMKLLPQLNASMSNPIQMDFKRPQHKSFPNIMGLYLLFRSTGLAYIEGSGTKRCLLVDEEILRSWQTLNPTERYFCLLETVILKARLETIDKDKRGGGYDDQLYLWGDCLRRLQEKSVELADDKGEGDWLRMFPSWYNLALMRMFGLIEIQEAAPDPGKGWKILSVRSTELGGAIYQELSVDIPVHPPFIRYDEEPPKEFVHGELQPRFQPFFPEWQKNLEIPEFGIQEGIYIFKTTIWKGVWRRIAIPGEMLLDRLSDAILEAFEFWDPDHLYRFIYTDRFGCEKYIDHPLLHEGIPCDEHVPFTDETPVQQVPLRPGRSMIFFFDFGDCWEFELLLEEIAPPDPTLKKPKLLEKHGKSPEQYGY